MADKQHETNFLSGKNFTAATS